MPWLAIEKARSWVGKQKGLLVGLVGVVADSTASVVNPDGTNFGVGIAVKIVGEIVKHGVDRLLTPATNIPDVKTAGRAYTHEQIDQINDWLAKLTGAYAGLLEHLEALTTVSGNETAEQLTALVRQTLDERRELRELFDAHFKEMLGQLQALPRIEEHIEYVAHEVHKVGLGMEEIKALLLELSPRLGEIVELRRARPKAVRALNEADAHFQAGRRDEGDRVLLDLVQQAGVGQETLCRLVGGRFVRNGDVWLAGKCLEELPGPRKSPDLNKVTTSLVNWSTRGTMLPVWRSLPRGFVVAHKYRVEEEVGRGGMASVYRAVPVMKFDKRRYYALKVPASELMADPKTRKRIEAEIEISMRLSAERDPHIVSTLGYEMFDDPHSRHPMYVLVLEFVEGVTLAQFLGQRAATKRWLSAQEVVELLRPVCEALTCAHRLGIYHGDLKPQNVMLPESSEAKLMDFGIARVLDERRESLRASGQALGTPIYMAPEMWETGVVDARTDVYLAGLLLAQLLTFKATGDPSDSARPPEYPVPEEWLSLFSESTSRSKGARPQTIQAFLEQLLDGVDESKQAEPTAPVAQPVHTQPRSTPTVQPVRAADNKLTGALGMKFAWLPAGTFWMGERGSQTQVAIPADFYIGVYPVTQGQWQAIMGSNPSYFSRPGLLTRIFGNGGGRAASVKDISDADLLQFPVEQVNCEDIDEFLKKLNDRERNHGLLYRLPTEAEWEYSCREGASSQIDCSFDFYLDQPTNDLSSAEANFDGNYPAGNAPKGKYLQRTSKVGSYIPNGLGICDMHGNVWEWTADSEGSDRVSRGGSWGRDGSGCRASLRYRITPSDRYFFLGFRLVAVPSGESVEDK